MPSSLLLVLLDHWCLDATGVAVVAGITTGDTGMVGSSATCGVARVVGTAEWWGQGKDGGKAGLWVLWAGGWGLSHRHSCGPSSHS